MSGIVGQNQGRGSGLVKATSVSLGNDSIDSQHYVDGSIDNAFLADGAVDTQEIADNAVSLAKMAGGTDGNIISYDASGNPVAVATGNSGQILTSAGAGAPPTFATAAGGGIGEIDMWRLTSNLTVGTSATGLTTNLARIAGPYQHTGNLGTGMTESSGNFQFPSTGWWEVTANVIFTKNGEDRSITLYIQLTDNSFGAEAYIGYQSIGINLDTGNGGANVHHSVIIDITDQQHDKVKFECVSSTGTATMQGSANYSHSYFKFIKLADT